MDIDRNFTYLCSMDIKKSHANQPRKQMQSSGTIDFRPTQRSASIEVSYSHSFALETLITNVQIVWANHGNVSGLEPVENVEVEISLLSSRGLYGQLINLKVDKEPGSWIYSGSALTHTLKITTSQKAAKKSHHPSSSIAQCEQIIEQINIYGITINSNPSSILLTKLLNISESFKKYNLFQEAAETDILAALALINARRFVLAKEILRKASKFYVERYQYQYTCMKMVDGTKLDSRLESRVDSRLDRSGIRDEEDSGHGGMGRSGFGTGRILESNKFLVRAAKIQLLIAETVSHPSLVFEKLQAYHRCHCYASGNANPVPLGHDADLQEVALKIFPQLCDFLLKILSDKLQPFRIASLKSIQFFIQTLGCSIGQSYLSILKQVTATYPPTFSPEQNPNIIPYGLQQLDLLPNKQAPGLGLGLGLGLGIQMGSSTKNKILMDHYHHLLQTLLSLMGIINRKILICAFSQIIVSSLLSKDSSLELKLYMLRFAERSVAISGADLDIQVSFIGVLLSFCEQKNVSKVYNNSSVQKHQSRRPPEKKPQLAPQQAQQTKQLLHSVGHYCQKILTNIKSRILPRCSGPMLQHILQWINKTLSYFGQNQILSISHSTTSNHSLFVFNTVLDFVGATYSVCKHHSIRITGSPVQAILYFLNLALYNQQNGLPFDRILDTFIVLVKYHTKMEATCQLDEQIISRILLKSESHTLSLKQLQILIKVLQISENPHPRMLQWLDTYLGCIPHSTYDETYKVFCIMLKRSIKNINDYPHTKKLLNKIVKTMLDQYTVKGKAHQQAKEIFISAIFKNGGLFVIYLLQICLLTNSQPKPQAYYSKRRLRAYESGKDNQHRFDSKSYKIDYEMFLEKLSMAQLILTTMSTEKQLCLSLLSQSFIQNFFKYIKTLSQSSSLKLKNKSLFLMNYFLQISRHSWRQEHLNIKIFSLIITNIFTISKILILKLKDSKLMYSPIYNLINLCRCLEVDEKNMVEGGTGKEKNCYSLEKDYEDMDQMLSRQENLEKRKGQRIIYLLLVKEFVKIWPTLGLSLLSSWENVREIYSLLIVQVFKEGLCVLPETLKTKVLEISKSLITSLLKSNEHNQRNAGLKIFGTLIGLRSSIQNTNNSLGNLIKDNLKYLKPFVQKIYDLTFDCDDKNVEIAENLCEILMSQSSWTVLQERRAEKMSRKGYSVQHSYLSFNLQQQLNFQKKNSTIFGSQKQFLKDSWLFDEDLLIQEDVYCPNITEELLCKILQFRNLIDKDIQAKTEVCVEKESFIEQNEEQFYDMGEEKAESVEAKERSQDDQLQFEDLGIIQLDDEEWSEEQEKSEKAIQKLPLKKTYKLSPSIWNPSKPQRIRSKRFHQNQFEYRQKIIVDEIEQKIANSSEAQSQPKGQIKINTNQTNDKQFSTKQKNKQTQKKQEKYQKIEKPKQSNNNNGKKLVVDCLVLDDFDVKEDREENIDQNYIEKWEKQGKKEMVSVKEHGIHQRQSSKQKDRERQRQRQRETQRKSKKPSAKKRKPSTGK